MRHINDDSVTGMATSFALPTSASQGADNPPAAGIAVAGRNGTSTDRQYCGGNRRSN